jgi:acyl transferase domain-containing protein/acyl carrier protein
MLCHRVDAVTEVPADRWPTSLFFDPERGRTGKTYSKWGAFLPDLSRFDAGFFGITDAEANVMDPQQRLLLEVSWEAMEDAGYAPPSSGARTGVYVGISTRDYEMIQGEASEIQEISPFLSTGVASSIAANRLSYCFNFTGPSLAVDTACSSSLLAVHLACQGLWNRECETALAGGVNCLITPNNYLAFASMGMLSPTGRCQSFDARANGFVRGEGAGALLLQPLSVARARGARIYAVILGSGTNQDGRTRGLAFPNRDSQAALLRQVSTEAGIAPREIVYMEAHGTGTPAGDPVETSALGSVFGAERAAGEELLIGSVKSNIGHLESGAGIAGIIKCALCLKHGAVPPNLHFETPNPAIDFARWHLKVPTVLEPLPPARAWCAGVNSFGFGGSNVFVLLRNHAQPVLATGTPATATPPAAGTPATTPPTAITPAATPAPQATGETPLHLLPLSARDPETLRHVARDFSTFLETSAGTGEGALADIIHASATRRKHHPWRLAVTGRDAAELRDRLQAFAREEAPAGLASGEAHDHPSVIFVFSGQGAQWWAMGRQLYAREEIFRTTIDRCEAALHACGGWSLKQELFAAEADSRVMDTSIAQPLICAIQIALAAQWAHWGIRPGAIIGHSVGEVAAAYCAGVFTLEEAMAIIYHRGQSMARVTGEGGMLAASLSFRQAQELAAPYGESLCIGAINAPQSVTFSGERSALSQLAARLTEQGIWNRDVAVNYAFHSRQMDPVRAPLLEALRTIAPQTARVPLYSTVTGERVEGRELTADYWWRNVREAVSFGPALSAMAREKSGLYLEIAAHPVLSTSIRQNLQARLSEEEITVLPSLRKLEDDQAVMLTSLGTLHCLGHDVAWDHLLPKRAEGWVDLPPYPWKHTRHWQESPRWTALRTSTQKHPLLMRRVEGVTPAWQCIINARLLPYVTDHAIQGRPLFPGAGYMELAMAVAAELYPGQPCRLQDLELERALFLPEDGRGLDVQIRLDPADRQFTILNHTQPATWTRNARGFLHPLKALPEPPPVDREEVLRRCTLSMDAEAFYAKTRQLGFQYGPMFRGIRQAWYCDGEALAQIELNESLAGSAAKYRMHPTLLDACLQLPFIVLREDDPQAPVGMFLPYGIDQLQLHAPLPGRFWAHARLVKQSRSVLVVNIQAFDESGRVLVELEGMRSRPMEVADEENFMNWFYHGEWRLQPLPRDAAAPQPAAMDRSLWRDLTRGLPRRAAALRKRMQLPRLLQQTRPACRQLWSGYILEALQELGWQPQTGEAVSAATLLTQLGLPDRSEGLLQRLLASLAAQGVLTADASGAWTVTAAPMPPAGPTAAWRALAERYPALLQELLLMKYAGEVLARVLTGEQEPRPLPNQHELSRLYEQAARFAPSWLATHQLLRQTIASLAARQPRGRKLRILELRAGTGGLAAHLAAELSTDTADYVATDPARHLPSEIEDHIRQYGFGECRTLDLSQEPAAQGFAPGQFDLVIGQDPFRTATSRATELRHAATLLAPGGALLFSSWDPQSWPGEVEEVLHAHWDLTGDDPQHVGRHHPSRSGWLELLQTAGLSQATAVSDLAPAGEHGRTLFLARKPEPAARQAKPTPSTPPPHDGTWLVLGDHAGTGLHIAEALRAQGNAVTLAMADSGIEQLLASIGPDVHDIIHTGSLDTPAGADLPLAALQAAQQTGCFAVLHLVQAISRLPAGARGKPRLWIVTRGAQPVDGETTPLAMAQTPLLGLGRVLRNEHPELHCRMLDLSPDRTVDDLPGILAELHAGAREDQVALRGPARYVERLVRFTALDSPEPGERGMARDNPCQLRIGRHGMLDQLRLRPRPRRDVAADEIEVEVCAASLNFRDVMKTLGVYPGDAPDAESLGDEFAGVVTRVGPEVRGRRVGERVFGVCLGAMATHVTVPASVCLPVPADMSLEEAATIPVVYLTAYHALHQLAQARRGERILIHSAAGGVGLAAVRLALQAGLEVFGTAGSPMKQQLLRNLGVTYVGNSRTLDFAEEIRALTGGEGVDIVLNSLAGEAIPRSLELLRLNGRFLEIGKRDIYGGTALSLKPFRNSLSYFAIDMARTLVPPHAGPLLRDIQRLLRAGTITPLPYLPFALGEAPLAFRFMAQGKHVGKLVLTADQTPVLRREAYLGARGRFRGDRSYLITGGLRGLGLSLAMHLAQRGARHLILTSQSGPASAESQAGLAALQAMQVRVLARQSDITSEAELAAILAEADATLPPLAGIIHAATVYEDGLLRDMTPEAFERPLRPKAYGAWNLHRQTLGRPLEFFVMVSSVSAVIGTAGQANYVAANTFLDMLAHHRHRLGLPALSLQMDRIRDVGHVARNQDLADYFTRMKWWGISSAQALEGFDRMLANKTTTGLLCSFTWVKTSSGLGTMLDAPRFEELVRAEAAEGDGNQAVNIRRRLDAAQPEEQRALITEFLLHEIASVLRTSPRKLPHDQTLKDIGMDSLMAVELMARVESKLGMALPIQSLSGQATVETLTRAALSMLGVTAGTPPSPAEAAPHA